VKTPSAPTFNDTIPAAPDPVPAPKPQGNKRAFCREPRRIPLLRAMMPGVTRGTLPGFATGMSLGTGTSLATARGGRSGGRQTTDRRHISALGAIFSRRDDLGLRSPSADTLSGDNFPRLTAGSRVLGSAETKGLGLRFVSATKFTRYRHRRVGKRDSARNESDGAAPKPTRANPGPSTARKAHQRPRPRLCCAFYSPSMGTLQVVAQCLARASATHFLTALC
jgi:hypothetical protein